MTDTPTPPNPTAADLASDELETSAATTVRNPSLTQRNKSWIDPPDKILAALRRTNSMVQFVAASVALVTFITWMSESDIRHEENDLRRTDLFIKMSDVIDRSRGAGFQPITTRAYAYLVDPKRGNLAPCGFDYTDLVLTRVSIFTLDNCRAKMPGAIILDASIYAPELEICGTCDFLEASFNQSLIDPRTPVLGEIRPFSQRASLTGEVFTSTLTAHSVGLRGFISGLSYRDYAAEEISIKTSYGDLSRSDIYSTLDQMVAAGLMEKNFINISAQSLDISEGIIHQAAIQSKQIEIDKSLLSNSEITLYRGDRLEARNSVLINSRIRKIDQCRQSFVGVTRAKAIDCEAESADVQLDYVCQIDRLSSPDKDRPNGTVKVVNTHDRPPNPSEVDGTLVNISACTQDQIMTRLSLLENEFENLAKDNMHTALNFVRDLQTRIGHVPAASIYDTGPR